MKKISLLSIGLFCGAFVLLESGCSTAHTVNTIENAQTVGQRQILADKQVIHNSSLNKAVRVIDISSVTTPSGYLKIQVKLQNLTRNHKNFSYRINWFDENSMPITLPTTSTIPMSIEGKEIICIIQIAPTSSTKDFRITFLPAAH